MENEAQYFRWLNPSDEMHFADGNRTSVTNRQAVWRLTSCYEIHVTDSQRIAILSDVYSLSFLKLVQG